VVTCESDGEAYAEGTGLDGLCPACALCGEWSHPDGCACPACYLPDDVRARLERELREEQR
jgi:hypothetical protein